MIEIRLNNEYRIRPQPNAVHKKSNEQREKERKKEERSKFTSLIFRNWCQYVGTGFMIWDGLGTVKPMIQSTQVVSLGLALAKSYL